MSLTVSKSATPLLQDEKSSFGEQSSLQCSSEVTGDFPHDLSSKRLAEQWYGKPSGSSSHRFANGFHFERASFSKRLDYVQDWKQELLKLYDASVSLVNLKSIDPFITQREEILLRISDAVFHRGWLYGNVIDFFLAKILENKPFMAALCWHTEYLCHGYEPRLRIQAKHLDPEKVFIPVNLNSHWVLIVADLKEKNFLLLDPADRPCSSEFIFLIRKWTNFLRKVFPLPEECEVPYRPHVCQQDDMSCGVFVCYYVYQLVNGCGIDDNFDVSAFRKYIYDTIVGECLDNERYSPCTEFELDRCGICNQKH